MMYAIESASSFNGSAFRTLTLGDPNLQAQLLSSFLHEVDDLRSAVQSAGDRHDASFEQVVHRLKNVSHFVSGERLGRVLQQVERQGAPRRRVAREKATHLILNELTALERAIREELAQHFPALQRAAACPLRAASAR